MSGSLFLTVDSVEVVKKTDRKLTFIPVVFILLRIWGTIRFFRLLACLPKCQHTGPRPAYTWLEILQVSMQPNKFTNLYLFQSACLLLYFETISIVWNLNLGKGLYVFSLSGTKVDCP